MGPAWSSNADPPEVLASRADRSLAIKRKQRHQRQVLKAMVKRVLESPAKAESAFDLRQLSSSAVLLLIKCCMPDLRSLLCVSATWNVKLIETMDQAFTRIESSFALVYSNLLFFKTGYISTSAIRLSDRTGLRVDRVLVAEPLDILIGHTVKLRCNYRFYQRPGNLYKFEFKFDCIKTGKRSVWVHRDECKYSGSDLRAYSSQIPTMCVGDSLEFSVNWFNLQGLVDLTSIEWQPAQIQDTAQILNTLQLAPKYPEISSRPQADSAEDEQTIKKRMYLYNVARHCEVELSTTEWYDPRYFLRPKETYIYDKFMPFLKLSNVEFAGVDNTVSRNTYIAHTVGAVIDAERLIGVKVEVKGEREEVVNEVKRVGLVFDRHSPVQLRLGDTFVLYISRGGDR